MEILGGVASTTGTLTLDLRRPRSIAVPGLSLVYTVNAGFRICSNGSVRVLGILGGPPIPSLPAPNPGVPTWGTEDSAMAQFVGRSDAYGTDVR